MSSFRVVIPARMGSTRLPGKVLREIAGRPMLAHVYERARESGAEEIVIAVDDQAIADVATALGAGVCLTDPGHASGTDRINEVAGRMGWQDEDIVVNLQGDEPCMPPQVIQQVADMFNEHPEADISTLCHRISSYEDWQNPNLVKVVFDNEGKALYFSRSAIPYNRDASGTLPSAGAFGHLGIYGYRVGALRRFSSLPAGLLENSEALEQLRALENGMCIFVHEATAEPGPGVDTEADLLRAAQCLEQRFRHN